MAERGKGGIRRVLIRWLLCTLGRHRWQVERYFRWLLCTLGRHRWQVERYWSLGELLVEGNVCADCKRTHRERTVIYRP